MKKLLALLLAMMMVVALSACGGGTAEPAPEAVVEEEPVAAPVEEEPADEGVTWADYQEYLIEKAGANAPDLDEFKGQVYAINSWEELDQTVSPWDQMFTTIGLSTWDEFQAGIVKEAAVGGGVDPSASGEATGEMDEASGEATGEATDEASAEPPASGTEENSAHGGTAGATSEADYQEYLRAWIAAEKEVNPTMNDDMFAEFLDAIDAMNFDEMPGDMFFNGLLVTGAAMTYDEFVDADGIY